MCFTFFFFLVNDFRLFGIITYDNMISYSYFHKFRILSYSFGVAISFIVRAIQHSVPYLAALATLIYSLLHTLPCTVSTSCFSLFKTFSSWEFPHQISFRCLFLPHYLRLSFHILNARISVLPIQLLASLVQASQNIYLCISRANTVPDTE